MDKPPVGSELKSIRPRGDAMQILVADDHDIVRRGLKQLLNSRPGWEVCAEASTGREAVTLAEQLKPKVVVMDISMPELNGLEAARKILKLLPKTEIVILSLHFSDQLVREILASGARGYIMKSDADRWKKPGGRGGSGRQPPLVFHGPSRGHGFEWIQRWKPRTRPRHGIAKPADTQRT